jgi:hypothetical protein
VAATGEGMLTYQWQKNQTNLTDGGHYTGCTTNALTVASTDANDAANYRCIITNSSGSVSSNGVNLTLKPTAEDFDKGTVEIPKENVVPAPGQRP